MLKQPVYFGGWQRQSESHSCNANAFSVFWGLEIGCSVIWEELGGEPMLLHIEKSQLRWLGHLASQGHVPPGGDPGEDPGHAGVTMSPSWPGNALGSSRRSVHGQGSLGNINMNFSGHVDFCPNLY